MILKGMELGWGPQRAGETIALINGRCSVYGDGIPDLLYRAGHRMHESLSDDGSVATCTVTRGDTGQTISRSFSVDDAKRAGLWQTEARVRRKSKKTGQIYEVDNDSPWYRYPKRMLQMRARGWACRDGAPDALSGLRLAEEERDHQMRDVTPPDDKGGPFVDTLQAARANDIDPPEDAQLEPILGSDAFSEGAIAAREGGKCPYDKASQEGVDWHAGFSEATDLLRDNPE